MSLPAGKTYWRLLGADGALGGVRELGPGAMILRREYPGGGHPPYLVLPRPPLDEGEVAPLVPEGGALHEITRTAPEDAGRPAIRLFFDIDLPLPVAAGAGPPLGHGPAWSGLVGALTGAIGRWAAAHRRMLGATVNLMASSRGEVPEPTKISLHATCPGLLFRDMGAVRAAALEIRASLQSTHPWVAGAVDCIYKPNQGLRVLWSPKAGTARRKVPVTPISAFPESTVHEYGRPASSLPEEWGAPAAPPPEAGASLGPELTEGDVGEAVALANAQSPSDAPGTVWECVRVERRATGVMANLARRLPSGCPVCRGCVHDNDNAFLFISTKGGGRPPVRFFCWRAKNGGGQGSADLGTISPLPRGGL
jgi:hypothetical protein